MRHHPFIPSVRGAGLRGGHPTVRSLSLHSFAHAGVVLATALGTVSCILVSHRDAFAATHSAAVAPRVLGIASVFDVRWFGMALWQWGGIIATCIASWLGGRLIAGLLYWTLERVVIRTESSWDNALLTQLRRPARAAMTVISFHLLIVVLRLPPHVIAPIDRVVSAGISTTVAWIAIALVGFGAAQLEQRALADTVRAAHARSVQTVVTLLRRLVIAALVLLTGALILMQSEVARNLGGALLASAGIATIVAGLAAQRSLANLLAGLQIVISQPVRVGDQVIVEGEFGTVEEINFTYVVLRVWDLRRLIVPLSYFLEKPFQNWTRTGTQLLGVAEIPADFTVPVAAVRAEFERICKAHPKWNGKVAVLQVTNASERHLTLRALVSTETSGDNFDLRCDVREQLIGFLQRLDSGRHLPRQRLEPYANGKGDHATPAPFAPPSSSVR